MTTPSILAINAALDVAIDCGVRLTGIGELRGGDSDFTAAHLVASRLEDMAVETSQIGIEGASVELGSVDRRTWSLDAHVMVSEVDAEGNPSFTLPDSGVTFLLREDGRGGRTWTFSSEQ